jgi:hypothetical protein
MAEEKRVRAGPPKTIRLDHQQLVTQNPRPCFGHFRLAEVSDAWRPRCVFNGAGRVFVVSQIGGVSNQETTTTTMKIGLHPNAPEVNSFEAK